MIKYLPQLSCITEEGGPKWWEVNDKHQVCLPIVMAQNTDCFGLCGINQLRCDIMLTSRISILRTDSHSNLWKSCKKSLKFGTWGWFSWWHLWDMWAQHGLQCPVLSTWAQHGLQCPVLSTTAVHCSVVKSFIPYVHLCKSDVGIIRYLHPNMAACETGWKFLPSNIHEQLFSCLIFYITD